MTDHRAESWVLISQTGHWYLCDEKAEGAIGDRKVHVVELRPGEQIGGAGEDQKLYRLRRAVGDFIRASGDDWREQTPECLAAFQGMLDALDVAGGGDSEVGEGRRRQVDLASTDASSTDADQRAHKSVPTIATTVPPNAAPVPVPPTDAEREREIDSLLHNFQLACEINRGCDRSKDRAILRNELRARLLRAQPLPPHAEWGVRDRNGNVVRRFGKDREAAKTAMDDYNARDSNGGLAASWGPYRLCRIIDES